MGKTYFRTVKTFFRTAIVNANLVIVGHLIYYYTILVLLIWLLALLRGGLNNIIDIAVKHLLSPSNYKLQLKLSAHAFKTVLVYMMKLYIITLLREDELVNLI